MKKRCRRRTCSFFDVFKIVLIVIVIVTVIASKVKIITVAHICYFLMPQRIVNGYVVSSSSAAIGGPDKTVTSEIKELWRVSRERGKKCNSQLCAKHGPHNMRFVRASDVTLIEAKLCSPVWKHFKKLAKVRNSRNAREHRYISLSNRLGVAINLNN